MNREQIRAIFQAHDIIDAATLLGRLATGGAHG